MVKIPKKSALKLPVHPRPSAPPRGITTAALPRQKAPPRPPPPRPPPPRFARPTHPTTHQPKGPKGMPEPPGPRIGQKTTAGKNQPKGTKDGAGVAHGDGAGPSAAVQGITQATERKAELENELGRMQLVDKHVDARPLPIAADEPDQKSVYGFKDCRFGAMFVQFTKRDEMQEDGQRE